MDSIIRLPHRDTGDQIPVIPIDQYTWGGDYQPKAQAQVAYIQGQGFEVLLTSWEENPYTAHMGMDSDVYKDSCLEAFFDFSPQEDKGYLNFETNSAGFLLCQFGKSREGRWFVREEGFLPPEPEVEMEDGLWRVHYMIPLSFIGHFYNKASFDRGDRIRANFYKCGEDGGKPHFASAFPIDNPHPDFHRPEFFREFVIGS